MKRLSVSLVMVMSQCRQDPIPYRGGVHMEPDSPSPSAGGAPFPTTGVAPSQGENRGVWISNVGGMTMRDPRQLLGAVELSAQVGLNTLYPVSYNRGCTFYVSGALRELAGLDRCAGEGLEGRDPLQELTKAAKARGLRVVPWFEWGVKLLENAPITKAFLKKNLVTTNVFGCQFSKSFGVKIGYLNVFNPTAQDHLVAFLKEQIDTYDIDGVQLDDHIAFTNEVAYDGATVQMFVDDVKEKKLNYRRSPQNQVQIRMKLPLPGSPPTTPELLALWNGAQGEPLRLAWEAYGRWQRNPNDPQGGTPFQKMAWEWATQWDARDEGVWKAWLDWRRMKLTEFFKRMSTELKAYARKKSKSFVFSLSPHSPRWSFERYSQDWESWLKSGIVDEVVVQNYHTHITRFENGLKAIADTFKNDGTLLKKISVGLSTGNAGDSPSPASLVQQMVLSARKMNFGGVAFFYFDSFAGLTGDPKNPKKQLFVTNVSQSEPLAGGGQQLEKLLAMGLALMKPKDIPPYSTPPQPTSKPSLAKLPFNPQDGCFDE